MFPRPLGLYNLGAGGFVGAAIVDLLHRVAFEGPSPALSPSLAPSLGPSASGWSGCASAGFPVFCLEAAELRLLTGLGLVLLGFACLAALL
eukprot:4234286-Alexandrium_andersonii.AAC.1